MSCKAFFVESVVNPLFPFNNHIGILVPLKGLGTGSKDFMLSHKMISLSFNGRLALIFQSFELCIQTSFTASLFELHNA